jgi:hypothetical protein
MLGRLIEAVRARLQPQPPPGVIVPLADAPARAPLAGPPPPPPNLGPPPEELAHLLALSRARSSAPPPPPPSKPSRPSLSSRIGPPPSRG